MKATEIRELTLDEIKGKEKDFREEIFNLKFRLSSGQLEDQSKIKLAKRNLARVLTIMKEKQKAG
ncbi:MAG: 50S ribosomal protein L29 [Candidatus Schekmanbacteria bacterium RBG_16_38_10]|uniref:Large ribosomal subunit protein uL29 n=1 Tax=Candidatus Schekmanbacteria bacterium RBG_16_38_10 TaxID=1817879 RepID=A0A1F7RVI6_9BACT|nr:MAG: 50S ribosomal protein L29 [Candidatus Schekmanbacteria bacterium RBG_16_38_10]